MQVIDGYRDLAPEQKGAAVAIGNFDGVHRGHRALIEAARAEAAAEDLPVGVMTFEPHPRAFFQPEKAGFRLTPWAEKTRLLEALGIDRVYRIAFDAELSAMTPQAFVRTVLVDGIGARHLTIGADFRFGSKRAGTPAILHHLGENHGIGVNINPLVGDESGEFASTAIRTLLREGRPVDAARALGRWHTVSGTVIEGDRRGRTLGYPTANLAFDNQLVPAHGIYAARVTVHEGPHAGVHDGVASIGERPTFGRHAPNFEVHLFDFSGDLYGAPISVALVEYLRPEVKFDGIEALIAQMDRDSDDARTVLADTSA